MLSLLCCVCHSKFVVLRMCAVMVVITFQIVLPTSLCSDFVLILLCSVCHAEVVVLRLSCQVCHVQLPHSH